jgi:hypothetical protein
MTVEFDAHPRGDGTGADDGDEDRPSCPNRLPRSEQP